MTTEFAVIDERSAARDADRGRRACDHCRARAARDPELADALAVVARHAAEERFGALMAALAAERGKLRHVLAEGHAELRDKLCRALDLPAGTTEEAVVAAFCAVGAGDEAGLRSAAAALSAGSCSDRERGAILAAWCEIPGQRRQMLPAYLPAFLTAEGEIRKILITRDAARSAGCDAGAVLCAEAERVKKFCEMQSATALVEASGALIRLGGALMDAYAELKRAQGVLDYDDLISAALDLLRRPGIAPWVLFKLDGGLDHILIDEAQDTNPEQWQIVAALAEEFFAGEGVGDRLRTIFAVGDAKQSIYSFQRADPRAFLAMREHFERRVRDARQGWRVVPLEVSFRSTEPVLRAIDAVFRHRGGARRRRSRRQRDPSYRFPRRTRGSGRAVAAGGRAARGAARLDGAAGNPPANNAASHPARKRDRCDYRGLAARWRNARGSRPADPAGRRHGAGAAAQRVRR